MDFGKLLETKDKDVTPKVYPTTLSPVCTQRCMAMTEVTLTNRPKKMLSQRCRNKPPECCSRRWNKGNEQLPHSRKVARRIAHPWARTEGSQALEDFLPPFDPVAPPLPTSNILENPEGVTHNKLGPLELDDNRPTTWPGQANNKEATSANNFEE